MKHQGAAYILTIFDSLVTISGIVIYTKWVRSNAPITPTDMWYGSVWIISITAVMATELILLKKAFRAKYSVGMVAGSTSTVLILLCTVTIQYWGEFPAGTYHDLLSFVKYQSNTIWYVVFVIFVFVKATCMFLSLRRIYGLCTHCGYNIDRIAMKVCPECGAGTTSRTT